MKQCCGWCQGKHTAAEYAVRIEQAKMLLQGDYKKLAEELKSQMLAAAENLEFEIATLGFAYLTIPVGVRQGLYLLRASGTSKSWQRRFLY